MQFCLFLVKIKLPAKSNNFRSRSYITLEDFDDCHHKVVVVVINFIGKRSISAHCLHNKGIYFGSLVSSPIVERSQELEMINLQQYNC